jgi:hypothetical protein
MPSSPVFRSANAITYRRVARTRRRCDSCMSFIRHGAGYLAGTIFPGHDVIDTPVPVRLAECSDCATRYGRGHLLEARRG